MRLMGWMTLCIALLLSAAAYGELLGGEVVVIANRNDPASMRVADHYMRARAIAPDHRIDLDLPTVTDISRSMYQRRVVEPVRAALRRRGLDKQVRCVVLSYGLPLRISETPATLGEQYEAGRLRAIARQTLGEIRENVEAIRGIGPARNIGTAGRRGEVAADLSGGSRGKTAGKIPGGARAIQQAVRAAAERIRLVRDADQRAAMRGQLMRLRARLFGVAGMIDNWSAVIMQTDARAKLARFRRRVQSVELAIMLLKHRDEPSARRERRRLVGKYFGLLGAYRDQLADLAHYRRTNGASLDSELMLLWWRDYPRNDRLANFAAYRYELIRSRLDEPPVLIAARLQARSEAVAHRMIADAVAVERTGLRGKAYLDARDITAPGYRVYDRSLRQLADALRGGMKVTLDRRPAVMARHSGKGAAIYCGWYALRQYNAPVTFVRGAVAYHIASFEATDFSQHSDEWAASLLDDGATVTLGAVAEPYLDAFPLPNDFFQLLATGRYTVGEVYLLTSRYVSWQMTLIGDPMYNPYRKHPAMAMAQVKLSLAMFGQINEATAADAQRIVARAIGTPPQNTMAEVPTR